MDKRFILLLYFFLAAMLQIVCGYFPVSFFAFPLNVIAAAIWLLLLWRLYKENRTSSFVRFLNSLRTSILSIVLLIAGSLVIGLFPQFSEAEAAAMSGISAVLGCYNFMSSWIFIAVLFLFLSNLGMITIHACYHRKQSRIRFLLNHIGLWMALFAGFFGSADVQSLRIPLYESQPERRAYDMNGAVFHLDYELELYKFEVEYYPNGMPSRFAADVRIGDEQAVLEVNHPYSYRFGEDIYLTGYDMQNPSSSTYCILQIVRQPWKYVIIAGILMMLAGAVLLFINGTKRMRQ